VIFRVVAVAFFAAALSHVAAVLIPAFGETAYPGTYPLWRHVLFILINITFAWLLLRQVRWVVWPFALLALQIYNGHGRAAWMAWSSESRFAWIDILTTVGATVFLVLLMASKRRVSERPT
jgi:hypothetical protein